MQQVTTTEPDKELGLRDIISMNEFKDNDSSIVDEITELEQLYSMTKTLLLDEANSNQSTTPVRLGTNTSFKKRNMMFISTQTSNLISIRQLKLNLIKQRADLKRDALDRYIKTIVHISKEGKEVGDEDNPSKILDFIVNHLNVNIGGTTSKAISNEDIDAILDSKLDNEVTDVDENIVKVEKKKSKKITLTHKLEYDNDGNILAYMASEEKLYVVTPNYDLIKELSEDEYDAQEDEIGNLFDAITGTSIEVLEE